MIILYFSPSPQFQVEWNNIGSRIIKLNIIQSKINYVNSNWRRKLHMDYIINEITWHKLLSSVKYPRFINISLGSLRYKRNNYVSFSIYEKIKSDEDKRFFN